MRLLMLSLIFLLTSFDVFSQFHRIVFRPETKTCSQSGDQYLGLRNWDVFQTVNDKVDGERIPFCEEFNAAGVTINGYEPSKPIFVKNTSPLNLGIGKNQEYNLFSTLISLNDQVCDCNTQCSIDSCYSVTMVTEGIFDNEQVLDTILLDNFQNCWFS